MIAAQDCLPDNSTRDKFAAEYSVLSRLWEALSPDHALEAYEADYKWLTQVYESVKLLINRKQVLPYPPVS